MDETTTLDPQTLLAGQPVLDAWQTFIEGATDGDTVEAVMMVLVVAWFHFCMEKASLSRLEIVRYLYEHWTPSVVFHVLQQADLAEEFD